MMSLAPQSRAESLSITSPPAGVTVEINGVVEGVAAHRINYPVGYFHRLRSVFDKRLEYPVVGKDGYSM
jgi:hypothetical protein